MANTLHTKQNTLNKLSNLSAGITGSSYSTISAANTITLGDSVLTARANPNSLDVNGKVMINGRDLEERLTTIEKVLQIPERDVILEAKHPKLKELYDDYIHALGKYRTWDTLKESK
jgi:hypothetical protein